MRQDTNLRAGGARSRREFIGGAAATVAGIATVAGVAGSATAFAAPDVEPAVLADLARLARTIVAFLPPIPKVITDPRPSPAVLRSSLAALPADRRSGVVASARTLTRTGEPPFASLPDEQSRLRLIHRSDHRRSSASQPGAGDAVAFTIGVLAPSMSAASATTSVVILGALPRYQANLTALQRHKTAAERQLTVLTHHVSPPAKPHRTSR